MGKPKFSQHLTGMLIVDKPIGPSSMQVVAKVRYHAERCKTGHAGTLDPLASGVLICCLGKATKSIDQIMGQTKVYETTIDLSAFTNTDDAEGEREEVSIQHPPEAAEVEQVIQAHIGNIEQRPPAYSAIKINGQRAYKLARKGEEVEVPTRIVRIDGIEILEYRFPYLSLRITCGKGTYIRSLGRQIGVALGTGGYLNALRRTAIGPYTIDQAVKLEDLPEPITQEHLLQAPAILPKKPK